MLPTTNFLAFIKQHQLFNANSTVLLAVSGGKDSVVMVHLFKQAGFKFAIAHCNFNLRGAEAKRDEAFVQQLALEMGVAFHVIQFDTAAFAEENKVSIQMAARTLRYNWFNKLLLNHTYACVALAQHQNDSVETVLLNLVRGTGITGLHGILPKRDNLIRPLLFLTRQEINNIVAQNDIAYVEDSSNASSKYARNKIRLEVMPHLRDINPSVEATFAQNINRFAEMETLLQAIVEEKRNEIVKTNNEFAKIAIADILKLNPGKLLLFELLKPYNFAGAVVDEVLNSLTKQSGTTFYSNSHQLVIDRNFVIVSVLDVEKNEVVQIEKEGAYFFNEEKLILKFSDVVEYKVDKNFAHVDADLLVFPLTIRAWQQGDKFKPIGMKSLKKLSDFFIDLKISIPQKHKIPLVFNGNGHLIWVAGLRQDERYKLTATTKKVAIFELLK